MSQLERHLSEVKRRKIQARAVSVLEGIGIDASEFEALPATELAKVWPKYLAILRDGGDSRRTWSEDQRASVAEAIRDLRSQSDEDVLSWFAYSDGVVVGFRVPSARLLDSALEYFVTPAGDLMLASRSADDGLCIEANRTQAGIEYEIVVWGRFVTPTTP